MFLAVFTGAAVSYYAQGVVQEYYNPSLSIGSHFYLRFEYGYSLFVGMIIKFAVFKIQMFLCNNLVNFLTFYIYF